MFSTAIGHNRTIQFYTLMCVIGTVLPYWAFISWLLENGIAPVMLLEEILASRLSMFAWADVLVSACALIWFINQEGRRRQVPVLYPLLGTCLIGVSLGLPLFLLLLELKRLEEKN